LERGSSPAFRADDEASFARLHSSVLQNVRSINTAISQIQALSSTIGTAKDSPSSRDKLRVTIDATKEMAKSTANDLKSLLHICYADRNKRTTALKLEDDLERVLRRFKEVSENAASKERTARIPSSPVVLQQFAAGTGELSPEPSQADVEREHLAPHEYQRRHQQQQQLLQQDDYANHQRAMILDRDEQVREIESAVLEVNDIFGDLARLSAEQSHMVDNVEANIESSAHSTAAALSEVQSAARHQRSSRSCLCWTLLLSTILAIVVIGVVYFGLKIYFHF